MSKKPAPYDAVPFKNRQGHTLTPGQEAIAITTSTGRSSLVVGKYLGVRKGGVVMQVVRDRRRFVDKNDVEYDHAGEYKELPWPIQKYTATYGSPAYRQEIADYKQAIEDRKEKVKVRQEGFTYKNFPYLSYTTLQKNNIYPGDIALRDAQI